MLHGCSGTEPPAGRMLSIMSLTSSRVEPDHSIADITAAPAPQAAGRSVVSSPRAALKRVGASGRSSFTLSLSGPSIW